MESNNIHFLYPAALFTSKDPYLVTTILGSCVSVCLYDQVHQIGGINHFMLPLWNGQGLASPKYGNIAIEKLLDKMIALGCNKATLQAKVFGGGEVIQTNISQFNIGARNIKLAFDMLDELKIPVIGSSVGGKLGRKILFNTNSFEIKQKFIQKNTLNDPV
jgi:chemotaxis protein CheD